MTDSSNNSSLVNLISQARQGDADALAELLERYRPFLLLVAARLVHGKLAVRQDASDVVQDTLIEIANGIGGFRGELEPEFSAWVKKILRNNVLNGVRYNRTQVRDIDKEVSPMIVSNSATLSWHAPAANASTPSQKLIQGEDALRLAAALETLPDDQRVAVALRYLEGKKLVEIAAQMERSDKSVAGLVHRGLKSLRASYEGDSRLLRSDLKKRRPLN